MLRLCVLAVILGVSAAVRPDGTTACDPALRPVIREDGDIFTSPNFDTTSSYPPSQQCEYLIQAPDALSFVEINFDYFNVDFTDAVEIFSGTDDTGDLLGTFNGDRGNFVYASPVGGSLFLKFTSDGASENIGFRGQVGVGGNDPCDGGITVQAKNGTITSPDYPSAYPNDANCQWNFVVDVDEVVEISFDALDIETGCAGFGSIYDYLEFVEGQSRLGIWYGSYSTDPNFLFTSNNPGSSVSLRFTSDFSISAGGFSVNYRVYAP